MKKSKNTKKSKKPVIVVLSVILVIILLLTTVGPQLVLMGAKQPEVAESYSYSEYFFNTYEEVRSNLANRC